VQEEISKDCDLRKLATEEKFYWEYYCDKIAANTLSREISKYISVRKNY